MDPTIRANAPLVAFAGGRPSDVVLSDEAMDALVTLPPAASDKVDDAASVSQAPRDSSWLSFTDIPFEGLLAGGVFVSFLVAFLAYRIAQSQREWSRWVLIVGCALISGFGVMVFMNWAKELQGRALPDEGQNTFRVASAQQNNVYLQKSEIDKRYAQASDLQELEARMERRMDELVKQRERLEQEWATVKDETERKLADVELRVRTPQIDPQLKEQLADLEDQVDVLRQSALERNRVSAAYSSTNAPAGTVPPSLPSAYPSGALGGYPGIQPPYSSVQPTTGSCNCAPTTTFYTSVDPAISAPSPYPVAPLPVATYYAPLVPISVPPAPPLWPNPCAINGMVYP
jgi:hypothetical protein